MEDIFSFRKVEKLESISIIVDSREKNSRVPSFLIGAGCDVVFEKLDVGDYLVGDIVIERKSFSDFIGSLVSGRLKKQLQSLSTCEKRILLLEGFYYNYRDFKISKNAVLGMLCSCLLDYGVPVLYSESEKESAEILMLLGRRGGGGVSNVRAKKKIVDIEEKKRFILEGFDGIGGKKSRELLERFENIGNVFNASEEELLEILDERVIRGMRDVLG